MENLADFPFENFLPGQEEVVQEIVHGANRNVVVNMKTLGGKTSAFQIAGKFIFSVNFTIFCNLFSRLFDWKRQSSGDFPASCVD